jgi:uncharacterized membrane protein YbhN (UPF0104 family)
MSLALWLTHTFERVSRVGALVVRWARSRTGKRLIKLVWGLLMLLLFGALAAFLWRNKEAMSAAFRSAQYAYFAATFVFYGVSVAAISFGWHLVLRHLGAQRNLLTNLKIYVYTLATRRIPGVLWYVAGRAVLYGQLGVSAKATSLASGIEVVLSVVSGLLIGAPALFVLLGTTSLNIALFALVELIGLSLLYPPILTRVLSVFRYEIDPGCVTLPRLASWLGAHALMWVSGGLVLYTVVRALYPVPISQIPAVVSLWALTGAISFGAVLLPSNFGATEITLSLLLSRLIPAPIGVATALLVRVLTTLFDLLWSSLFFLDRQLRRQVLA